MARAFKGARPPILATPLRTPMQRVLKSVLVPYSAQQMFDLVEDVECYPEFLPWCSGSGVLETHENCNTARLDIN